MYREKLKNIGDDKKLKTKNQHQTQKEDNETSHRPQLRPITKVPNNTQ